ncbi:MAG: chemotaxis protein CheA [Deltaproteobacteria bacterium]|nr:chemotaxis protein CheA [Deltaproteobacteria bacterium]
MTPLLEQFLSESRESLQGIGEKLMQLEKEPNSSDLMIELFRLVHTLKGNSGLFDMPELTRVLHAGEDLMDAVRNGAVAYSPLLADRLLDAMDFVGMLCDEIEADGSIHSRHINNSVHLADALRQLIDVNSAHSPAPACIAAEQPPASAEGAPPTQQQFSLDDLPEDIRMGAYRSAVKGAPLHWLAYSPDEECFFQGDDPFHQARQTPGIQWGSITARRAWPKLSELDPYCCILDFTVLSSAPHDELEEYYRYVPNQVRIDPLCRQLLILPQGDPNGGPVYEDFVADALSLLLSGDIAGLTRAARSMLELSNPDLWISSALRWLLLVIELEPDNIGIQEVILLSLRTLTQPAWHEFTTHGGDTVHPVAAAAVPCATEPVMPEPAAAPHGPEVAALIAAQRAILSLPDGVAWLSGRIRAAAATLSGCLHAVGSAAGIAEMEASRDAALEKGSSAPLLSWLNGFFEPELSSEQTEHTDQSDETAATISAPQQTDAAVKFGRRTEDAYSGPKSIKVDQAKIDHLMNLIGEMVVAKNALPYLAGRAETVFGVRDLSREIKAQYAVINRIAEEMQDSIMQVRMMPVSFVFQRFPRLVRDTSNKLEKEVNLILEGEDTEADKNVIESLGDPLMHIVRNSLDHGIETPAVRRALGKPAAGTIVIRATQESDRVIIEIRDDGKGIDPDVIKRKAFEKGVIDQERLERITDQEAVNLVFAAGFSTAEVVSDLSGRGVGMDVVRTAVEKVNGTINLESEKGQGTRISLSVPLSMAITNVMIVESNQQIFGIPMETVLETVRIPRADIHTIKKNQTTVLRGRIVPLKTLNSLLGLDVPPKANEEDELAVLIVNLQGEPVGIVVDDFRETVDIILKPMTGVLAGLSAYSGSALLGDGSVLMVLDIKEII